MQFGDVRTVDQEELLFIEAIKKSFGIPIRSVEEGKNLLRDIFLEFESRKDIYDNYQQDTNIFFYNGNAYINEIQLTSTTATIATTFSNINYQEKCYRPIKLYGILGFEERTMKALEEVKDSYNVVLAALQTDQQTIRDFWYEIIEKSDTDIDQMLKNITDHLPTWLVEYLTSTANFIHSVRVLGYDTQQAYFDQPTIDHIYHYAQEVGKQFLTEFGRYISSFSEEDGKLFKGELEEIDDFLSFDILSDYSQFTHTSYMVKYIIDQGIDLDEEAEDHNIYMISYYDLCECCEALFANSPRPDTKNQWNMVVISGAAYDGSRERLREDPFINKNLIQIFLEDQDLSSPSPSPPPWQSIGQEGSDHESTSSSSTSSSNSSSSTSSFSSSNSFSSSSSSISLDYPSLSSSSPSSSSSSSSSSSTSSSSSEHFSSSSSSSSSSLPSTAAQKSKRSSSPTLRSSASPKGKKTVTINYRHHHALKKKGSSFTPGTLPYSLNTTTLTESYSLGSSQVSPRYTTTTTTTITTTTNIKSDTTDILNELQPPYTTAASSSASSYLNFLPPTTNNPYRYGTWHLSTSSSSPPLPAPVSASAPAPPLSQFSIVSGLGSRQRPRTLSSSSSSFSPTLKSGNGERPQIKTSSSPPPSCSPSPSSSPPKKPIPSFPSSAPPSGVSPSLDPGSSSHGSPVFHLRSPVKKNPATSTSSSSTSSAAVKRAYPSSELGLSDSKDGHWHTLKRLRPILHHLEDKNDLTDNCPLCGCHLVLRDSVQGKQKCCIRFPTCSFTKNF